MRTAIALTLLPLLYLLSGCVEDLTADDTSAFAVLARGETAQSDDKHLQVISNQSSFDDVHYRLLNRSGAPASIDFEQYQVLLVMAGAGYPVRKIDIDGFVGLPKQVQINVKTDYAGDNCATPTVVRQPWLLVLFPKVSKPLQIQEQLTLTHC